MLTAACTPHPPLHRRLAVLLRSLAAAVLALAWAGTGTAQLPTPTEAFGFQPGADYRLADYDQMLEYYRSLDAATDRMRLIEIGASARGRPMVLAIVSSDENIERLDHWRESAQRLARARISGDEARRLAADGPAVVWIDGGLDDQEYATGQMMPELIHRVVADESDVMRKVRANVVSLLMPHMNPEGSRNDITWYREQRGTPWEIARPPRLGQPYVGTDNNRDWFMITQPETWAASRIFYHEWYPQIVYNQHQTGPDHARIFIPPYADPVNPNIHPIVSAGVRMVGAAMAAHLSARHMPGYVSRAGYSMWWNGGMRLTPYYHNQIGILTETSHRSPTPYTYDLDAWPETLERRRGEALRTDGSSFFHPDPWKAAESHFREAVEYMVEASIATLNLAANYREELQLDVWRMGRDAIEAGEGGDPFAYVIPPEQHDPGEAVALVNVLRRGGVEIHRATSEFRAGGRRYAEGSYVAYAGQAYRPHLVDLMEPQNYPDLRQYPGGPPERPYDLTGWTLPMQMGVRVDRVDEPFRASADPVETVEERIAGEIRGSASWGYALSHDANASARAVNRILAAGEGVEWATGGFTADGRRHAPGTFVVRSGGSTDARVRSAARELGVDFVGLDGEPDVGRRSLELPRVGLYKSWVPRVDDQGWTLWLMEEYEFPVDTLHDADVRGSDLSRYDAIILPSQEADGILKGNAPGTMPPEYVGGVGAAGVGALDRYARSGGTLIAFDAASDFVIDQLGLPVRNVVPSLPESEFFIPGSLIRMDLDVSHPLAYGMQEQIAASYQRSRAFEIVTLSRRTEGGVARSAQPPDPPVEVVTRYAEDDVLMSGWALGPEHIAGRPATVQVPHGEGSVVLFAYRPQFRGQPRGTYQLIFNAIHLAAGEGGLTVSTMER